MSLNKVMLIGNVGAEPEVRYVDQGVAVASLRIATTRKGYTLQSGTQVPEQTDWHNVVLWRKLAETAEKYVHKGDKLYVEGSLHTRSYDDKNGVRRYRTEIWGDTIEMLSPPKQQASASPAGTGTAAPSASPSGAPASPSAPTASPMGAGMATGASPVSPTGQQPDRPAPTGEERKDSLPF